MTGDSLTQVTENYKTLMARKVQLQDELTKHRQELGIALAAMQAYEDQPYKDGQINIPVYPSHVAVQHTISDLQMLYRDLVPLAIALEEQTGGKFPVD